MKYQCLIDIHIINTRLSSFDEKESGNKMENQKNSPSVANPK